MPIKPLRPMLLIQYPCPTRPCTARWRSFTTRCTPSDDFTFMEKLDRRSDLKLMPDEVDTASLLNDDILSPDQLAGLDPSSMVTIMDKWIKDRGSSRNIRVLLKNTCATIDGEKMWMMLSVDGISERLRMHLFRILASRYDGDLDGFLQRVPRNIKYFNTAARACMRINRPDQALLVIEQMKAFGLEADAATFNIFIRARIIEEDIDMAVKLYNDMLEKQIIPNAATFNIFLKYACQKRNWNDLSLWLDRLENHVTPNGITLRILLGSLLENHKEVKLIDAFERVAKVVPITEVDEKLKTGIVALLRQKRSTSALALLQRILTMNIPISRMTCNMLIHAFCQKGDIDAAHKILKVMVEGSKSGAMPSPDVVSFTNLISAYTHGENATDLAHVIGLYEEMIQLNVATNAKLQSALLYALVKSNFGDIKHAKSLFRLLVREDDKWKEMNVSPTTQEPWVSQTSMYNIMMDGLFLHFSQTNNRKTLYDAYSLLKEAYEKELRLTPVTLNIWVRGLVHFDNDLDGADEIVAWFAARDVDVNERTIWYLINGSCRRGDHARARRYLHDFESKGHVLQGHGAKRIKAMIE